MKSILNRAAAVIAVAVLGGCAETMLPQPADALQSVTNQIIKEQNMQEQTAPQKDALGVAIEIGKTTVIPFIQLLGKPQAENLLAEDRAQIAWATNRLMSGKKGETPVVVIFPPDDPRVASISMQILAIQAKKVEGVWMVEGLKLGPAEPKPEEGAK